MADKHKISTIEFNRKVQNKYDSVQVKVKLGDLEKVLRAARKTITFYLQHDNYVGPGLAVDAQEMADAYKSVNDLLEDIRRIEKYKAKQEVGKDYEVKEL